MGGPSAEHEVSLETGGVVLDTLDKSKYNALPVTITKNGGWILPARAEGLIVKKRNKQSKEKSLVPLENKNALDKLANEKAADVVFIAMHGTYGEDGTIQGLLDAAGIPYTGSGVLASALAMDKVRSSKLLAHHRIDVPKFLSFSKTEWFKNGSGIAISVKKKIGLPCVIKPSNCGSSIGITIVKKPNQLSEAIELASQYSPSIIAQEYIAGCEVTCAVLDEGTGKNPLALPPTEIIPKGSKFFDYYAKYTAGASEEITPPHLPKATINKIQQTALKTHQIIGCSGMSRTDMILSNGKIYVLELNTIPGMTQTSLLPQAASAAGIPFPELLDKIINAALNSKDLLRNKSLKNG